MSDKQKLRVCVIGAGGIARNVHLPSLTEMDDVEVVAISDVIEERAKERAEQFSIPKTYILFKEMLAKEEPDAVFVLVEPSSHFHVVNACLAAGYHTFMEKPPGITSFQSESLKRAAANAGRILQVGFNRRHIPLVQKVLAIMRENTTITQVEGRFMKYGKAAFDKGGANSLVCDVIHVLDLVRYIADGEPAKVATVAGQDNDVVANRWNSVVEFDNSVTGVIKSNYQTGARVHTFEIHGPGASAFINLGFGGKACDARVLLAKGAAGYSISAKGAGNFALEEIDGMALVGSQDFHRYYGFYQEDAAFLDCVREGSQPMPNIEDAVKTFRFVDMVAGSVI